MTVSFIDREQVRKGGGNVRVKPAVVPAAPPPAPAPDVGQIVKDALAAQPPPKEIPAPQVNVTTPLVKEWKHTFTYDKAGNLVEMISTAII
jgi:hypothetical protein